MAAVTNIFEPMEAFRTKDMDKPRPTVVLTFEDQKKVSPRFLSGVVVVNGEELVIDDNDGKKRMVRVTYSTMRVLQYGAGETKILRSKSSCGSCSPAFITVLLRGTILDRGVIPHHHLPLGSTNPIEITIEVVLSSVNLKFYFDLNKN